MWGDRWWAGRPEKDAPARTTGEVDSDTAAAASLSKSVPLRDLQSFLPTRPSLACRRSLGVAVLVSVLLACPANCGHNI